MHAHVLKYYILYPFKEIAIDFKHILLMILKFSAGISDGFLFKWLRYPFHQFIFTVAGSFVGLSFNCTPRVIISESGELGDQMLMVMQSQKQSMLNCPACLAEFFLIWIKANYVRQKRMFEFVEKVFNGIFIINHNVK